MPVSHSEGKISFKKYGVPPANVNRAVFLTVLREQLLNFLINLYGSKGVVNQGHTVSLVIHTNNCTGVACFFKLVFIHLPPRTQFITHQPSVTNVCSTQHMPPLTETIKHSV